MLVYLICIFLSLSLQYKGSRVMPACRMRQCEFLTHCRRWRLWQTRCPSFRASCRPARTFVPSGMRYWSVGVYWAIVFVCCQGLNKNTHFRISVSGLLSGDKADQSCASAEQPSQSGSLASSHLHELHLPPQPSHPEISSLPPQEVCVCVCALCITLCWFWFME